MIHPQLDAILNSIEFEDNGSINITGTDWYSDDVRIEFVIRTGIEQDSQLWEVQIEATRSDLIKSEHFHSMSLSFDHPLLWPFKQFQTNLYFARKTEQPFEVFFKLSEVHQELCAEWIPFGSVINSGVPTLKLLTSGAGMLAKGPLKLLSGYKTVLEQYDMGPTFAGGHEPKRWTGKEFIAESSNLKVLLLGNSFVVADNFTFARA